MNSVRSESIVFQYQSTILSRITIHNNYGGKSSLILINFHGLIPVYTSTLDKQRGDAHFIKQILEIKPRPRQFLCLSQSNVISLCASIIFSTYSFTFSDLRIIVPPLLPPILAIDSSVIVSPLALITASETQRKQSLPNYLTTFFYRCTIAMHVIALQPPATLNK